MNETGAPVGMAGEAEAGAVRRSREVTVQAVAVESGTPGVRGPVTSAVVTYFGGAANGLGISMSLESGHFLINSGIWPSGYHSSGGISLASIVALITS